MHIKKRGASKAKNIQRLRVACATRMRLLLCLGLCAMVRAGRIGAPAFKRDVAGAAETPQRGPEVVKRAVPVAPEIGEDGEVVKRAVPLGPGEEREEKEGMKRAVADDSEGLRRPIEASASGLEGMPAMAFKRAAEEAFEEQEEENAARFRKWLGEKNENQDAGDRRR